MYPQDNGQAQARIWEPLLKIADVEGITRLDRRTIFRLCLSGEFPKPIRIGGSRRWRKDDIERLMKPAEATT